MISNNENYLKNILRKTRTKKLQNFKDVSGEDTKHEEV